MVLSILAVSSIAQAQDLSQLFGIKTRTSGFCNQTLTQAQCNYYYDFVRVIWKTEDHIAKPGTPAGCHRKHYAEVPSSGAYVHYNPDSNSTANCSEWNQCICANEATPRTNGTCATKMSYTECDASRASFSIEMHCAYEAMIAADPSLQHLCTEQGAFDEDTHTSQLYLKNPMATPKGCSVRMMNTTLGNLRPHLQYKKFDYGESAPVPCSEVTQCLCKEDMTHLMHENTEVTKNSMLSLVATPHVKADDNVRVALRSHFQHQLRPDLD